MAFAPPANNAGHHEVFEGVLRTSLGGATPPWLATFTNTLNQIQQTVERTSAVLENMRIARSNVELAKNTGITAYRAKQKEVDGDGTILANSVARSNNQIPLVPLAAAPAVGAIFSPMIETDNLDHPTVLRIIQFYNQDFGIQPTDTLPVRVQKIMNWLTSEI